jgi:hypothetical protein
MARQFKVEFKTPIGDEEVYIHDNNDIEHTAIAPIHPMDCAKNYLDFLSVITVFMRCREVTKLEVKKLP